MWLAATVILGWLGIIGASTAPASSDPGHLFIPVGKIYPSYSSWAITISISIAPFRKQTDTLLSVRLSLERLVNELKTNKTNDVHAYQLETALRELNGEVSGLSHAFKDLLYPLANPSRADNRNRREPDEPDSPDNGRRIKRILSQSEPSHKRTKRGLIDGLGKAFSYLFGTATEGEIAHLENNIDLLNQKDMAIAHQFNGTLRVLNATRVAATENRRALRTLSTAVNNLEQSYHNTVIALRGSIASAELSFKISSLTTTVMRTTQAVQYLYAELSALAHQFAFAQVGILHKNIMPKQDLRRLLRKIDKSLPTGFKLPYSIDQTNEYIRSVKTKLIESTDAYHVLFYVPLLHTKHAFDMYRFFPYQVPLHSHNVSLAYYPDEPRYLLISEDRQHFIQPEPAEVEACILNKQPFCPLHEPAYSTAGSTSCVVALFRKDSPAADRYCFPRIIPAATTPQAYYLTNGKWLLVSRPPMSLTIVCSTEPQSRAIIINQPVQTLTLDPECAASSDSFYLPPYYAGETHLDLPVFTPETLNDNNSLPIWRPNWSATLTNLPAQNLSRLPTLHITGMQADRYFDMIEAQPLEQVTLDSPSAFSKSMLLMIIIGVLTFCCLAFCLKHCCVNRTSCTLPRVRPMPSEHHEPALEMMESPPMVAPPSADSDPPCVEDCAQEPQCITHPVGPEALPHGGIASTLSPATVASVLSGTRPTPRLPSLV